MTEFQWPAERRVGFSPGSSLRISLLLLGLALVPARAAHVTFAAIGDYGNGSTNEGNVARLVKSWRPAFIITLGDNNYPSGKAETIDANIGQFYHEFIHPYVGNFGAGAGSNRFFPSLGNHDWITTGASGYLDYFTLPGNERYYTFTNGPVQLFCLDSDRAEPDGITPESIQGQWLRRELAASTAPWKLVYFHHAPYSSGSWHGTYSGETAYFRWPFKEWGATAVLAGHDHIYERVFTGRLTYFVNGLGGDSYDPPHRPLVSGSQKFFTGDFAAMRMDATETNLTFRFITWRGRVMDTHVLVGPPGRPPAR